MTRREYINTLEAIREQANRLSDEFKAAVLSDRTEIEAARADKTAKLFRDLRNRLYEDIAICMKVTADKVAAGE